MIYDAKLSFFHKNCYGAKDLNEKFSHIRLPRGIWDFSRLRKLMNGYQKNENEYGKIKMVEQKNTHSNKSVEGEGWAEKSQSCGFQPPVSKLQKIIHFYL